MGEYLDFTGRVAVITGAGRGLGRAHALELSRRGAAIVVNDIGFAELEGGDRLQPVAQEVVDEIRAAGGRAIANSDDAATAEGCARAVQAAIDEFGRIDIAIANAGTSQHVSFAEMTFKDFEFLLSTHLFSTFHLFKAAWPHFQRANYGRAIVTTSGVGMFGLPGSVHYGTAKGALYGMMRGLALEGQQHGIAVNAFWPSAFTRMIRGSEDLVARMRKGMAVEKSLPVATWLAHHDCTANGELFHGGSERVSRVVVSETRGFHLPGLSADDIADNLDAIMDDTERFTFRSAIESSELQTRLTS